MRLCRTSETKDGSPCSLLFRLHPCLVSEGRQRVPNNLHWVYTEPRPSIQLLSPNTPLLSAESCRRNIWSRRVSQGTEVETTEVNTRLRRRWPKTRARELHNPEQQPGKPEMHWTSQKCQRNISETVSQLTSTSQPSELQLMEAMGSLHFIHFTLKTSNPRRQFPSWSRQTATVTPPNFRYQLCCK